MAVQEGAKYLEKVFGGFGILLGGVPGVLPAEVLILGGGVVGTNAAKMAAGLGAHVTLLDISLDRLRYLSDVLAPNVDLLYSNRHNMLEQLAKADVVIGAVLLTVPKRRSSSSVVIEDDETGIGDRGCRGGSGWVYRDDEADDATISRPIVVDGVIHYAVANMPGGCRARPPWR